MLDWSASLTGARTLGQLAVALAQPPRIARRTARRGPAAARSAPRAQALTGGDGQHAEPLPGLRFVDSLSGVAPGYGTLHAPWSGAYHAADHGLLIGAEAGCSHLLLLPLPRTGGLTGVYNIGSLGGPVSSRLARARWLELVAAQALVNSERQLQRARLLRAGVVDPLDGLEQSALFPRQGARAGRGRRASRRTRDVSRHRCRRTRRHQRSARRCRWRCGRVRSGQRDRSAGARERFVRASRRRRVCSVAAGHDAEAAAQLAERILRAVRAARCNAPLVDEQHLKVSVGIAGLDMVGIEAAARQESDGGRVARPRARGAASGQARRRRPLRLRSLP